MIKKNIEKQERKSKRYPPIPPVKKGPTKSEILKRAQNKHSNTEIEGQSNEGKNKEDKD